MAIGYAYINAAGEIVIASISASTRAAKVNAIVVQSDWEIMPMDDWTDDKIDLIFDEVICGIGRIAKVEITLAG